MSETSEVPRIFRIKTLRRNFLKGIGLVGLGLGAFEVFRRLGGKLPEDDKEFQNWLTQRHKEWEENEIYQEWQIIDEPVVYNIESVNMRSKPVAGYSNNIVGKVEPGTLLPSGKIIIGGYVPEPGGRDQSNRWLEFKYLDEKDKEKTAYISAIFIVPKEEYKELTGVEVKSP